MRKANFILTIFIFVLVGCKVDKPKVIQLTDFTYVEEGETYYNEKFKVMREFFVIANTPDNNHAIKTIVKNYNSSTLSQSDLQKYFGWIRVFYKETPNTPRDYTEKNNGYFDHDRLESHGDDIVLIVKWTDFGKSIEYSF